MGFLILTHLQTSRLGCSKCPGSRAQKETPKKSNRTKSWKNGAFKDIMETKDNLNSFRTRTYTPSVWLPDRGIPQKEVSKTNIDAYPGTSRNSADPRRGKDATHPSEPDIVNVIMQRRFTAQLCCCIVIVSGWILGGYCASSVCEFSCASRLCGFLSAWFITFQTIYLASFVS